MTADQGVISPTLRAEQQEAASPGKPELMFPEENRTGLQQQHRRKHQIGGDGGGGGDDDNGDESRQPPHPASSLQRRLKSRHVQFLALSGAIGTGLFVGSGQVLSLAGPLSATLAYALTGLNLYCVMQCLGEMAAWLPVPGAVPVFAARFVDPALGFTLGWSYWYQFAIGVPVEVSACAVVVDYWRQDGTGPAVPRAALVTALFAPIVLVNCLPVRIYGEAEFFFGAVKLTTIVGLILLMLVLSVGGGPNHDPIGFRFWKDPGPMNAYLADAALGRFLAFWKVFIQATFAYGGSEMVVVASGETENPRRNIPKAVRRVFWRIALFYVCSIFLVGLCVSSHDPRLLNAIRHSAPGAAQSPFVIAIENAGIGTLPSLINAVILSSAWSAANSLFYAATRVLYSAAQEGKAPSLLRSERKGIPYLCVAITALLSCLVYLNVNHDAADVFFWISSLSAVNTLLVWASVSYTYLRFRQGLSHQGVPRDSLPYRAPLQPYLARFAITFCLLVAVFNGFDSFFPVNLSAKALLPSYISFPIFLILFFGYKLTHRTRRVPLSEMDIWTDKIEIDQLESTWQVDVPRNWLEKLWFWIA